MPETDFSDPDIVWQIRGIIDRGILDQSVMGSFPSVAGYKHFKDSFDNNLVDYWRERTMADLYRLCRAFIMAEFQLQKVPFREGFSEIGNSEAYSTFKSFIEETAQKMNNLIGYLGFTAQPYRSEEHEEPGLPDFSGAGL